MKQSFQSLDILKNYNTEIKSGCILNLAIYSLSPVSKQ